MHDLTQGSVRRHLLSLSAFMAVSMVFQTLYYLARREFRRRLTFEPTTPIPSPTIGAQSAST